MARNAAIASLSSKLETTEVYPFSITFSQFGLKMRRICLSETNFPFQYVVSI